MNVIRAEIHGDERYVLGEGPCWNGVTGELTWVDIKQGMLCGEDSSGIRWALQTGQYLGAAIPTESGKYIGCMTTGIYLLDREQILSKLAQPDGMEIWQRFNDAKCDPCGRLFAGTMPLFALHLQEGGRLYRYAGGQAVPLDTPVIVPNGMAWTADGRKMYLVETALGRIDAFDYDPETGIPSHRREAFRVENGAPDGMCIDEEGLLWIAIWGAGEVRQYDPASGKMVRTVCVPVQFPSSCCFGGPDLNRLYITSAAENDLSEHAGKLFVCEPPCRGAPVALYKDQ